MRVIAHDILSRLQRAPETILRFHMDPTYKVMDVDSMLPSLLYDHLALRRCQPSARLILAVDPAKVSSYETIINRLGIMWDFPELTGG